MKLKSRFTVFVGGNLKVPPRRQTGEVDDEREMTGHRKQQCQSLNETNIRFRRSSITSCTMWSSLQWLSMGFQFCFSFSSNLRLQIVRQLENARETTVIIDRLHVPRDHRLQYHLPNEVLRQNLKRECRFCVNKRSVGNLDFSDDLIRWNI